MNIKWILLLAVLSLFVSPSIQEDEEKETSDVTKKLAKFQSWYFSELEKAGSKRPKLILAESPIEEEIGENGIFAEENVNEDDFLLRVPFNLMITPTRILEVTELGEVFDRKEIQRLDLNDSDILTVYLAYSKFCGPEVNPWTLWLDVLPERMNSALYFTDAEMKLLEGSPMKAKAEAVRAKAKETYEAIAASIEAKGKGKICKLTYNNWRWAQSIVASRKVELVDENQSPFTAVIPYFDFFNHADFKEEKWSWGYKADHKFFHVSAIKPVRKGHQIYQFYGPFSNSKLLLDYGFILEQNSFNSVEIEPHYFGVDPEDDFFEIKTELLAKYQDRPEKRFVMKDSMSQELLESAHIINGGEDDFTVDRKLVKKYGPLTDFYMGQFFQAVLTHKLQQYPTTLKDDEDLMRTSVFSGMSRRSRMAIKVRAEEKSILSTLIDLYAKKEQMFRDHIKKLQEEENHDEL